MNKNKTVISYQSILSSCIGVDVTSVRQAKELIDKASEELLRDIANYFEVITDVSDLSLQEIKGLLIRFLDSNDIQKIVEVIADGLEVDTFKVLVKDEDEKTEWITVDNKRTPLLDKKLKEIARGLHEGKIFCDTQIREGDSNILLSIFMPLVFMSKKDIWLMQKHPPGLMYEYMDKAGPRSVNGYPCFFSMRILSLEDTKRMSGFYKEYHSMVEQFNEGSK